MASSQHSMTDGIRSERTDGLTSAAASWRARSPFQAACRRRVRPVHPSCSERSALRRLGRLALPALLAMGCWALADPQAAIVAGNYVEAYDEARAVDTAVSQVLAATAASDYAVYVLSSGGEAMQWLQRAREAAQRAVTLDPEDAEGYVQLARARGEMAQRAGIFESLDVVPVLKKLFDRALALEPDNADALVGLALWNLELTNRGVGWLFGARREDVLPLLRRGVEAAPAQVNLHVEFATALRALGDAKAADEQLRIALALPATTAVDRYEQERARRLLADNGG